MLYLANLYSPLQSKDGVTTTAAARLFGSPAAKGWLSSADLTVDLVAAGFSQATEALVSASTGWRLAAQHLSLTRDNITLAGVSAYPLSEGHDDGTDGRQMRTANVADSAGVEPDGPEVDDAKARKEDPAKAPARKQQKRVSPAASAAAAASADTVATSHAAAGDAGELALFSFLFFYICCIFSFLFFFVAFIASILIFCYKIFF